MPSVEFFGEQLELRKGGVSQFALMEFAEAASGGVDADAMEGMAAMLRFICDGLDDASIPAFRRLARKNRAEADDLKPILQRLFAGESDYPTGLPSDSTDGQESTPANSVSASDAKVMELSHGRLDRLAMLKEHQKAVAAQKAKSA